MPAGSEYLDMRGIAELLDVKLDSVHTYHTRAKRHRAAGRPRPGDLPEPDATFGRTPVWLVDTIERWRSEVRPGQGVGGGRPSHRTENSR